VPAYVIYQCTILDAERYEEYKMQAAPSVAAAGGRYLVRGGDVDLLEGDLPAERTVILEFPDRASALAWYASDRYTEIRRLRDGAARASVYAVDGLG
jgi:uncharacterized protein (DUF1330 family)